MKMFKNFWSRVDLRDVAVMRNSEIHVSTPDVSIGKSNMGFPLEFPPSPRTIDLFKIC